MNARPFGIWREQRGGAFAPVDPCVEAHCWQAPQFASLMHVLAHIDARAAKMRGDVCMAYAKRKQAMYWFRRMRPDIFRRKVT
jgi:hypothetical protein